VSIINVMKKARKWLGKHSSDLILVFLLGIVFFYIWALSGLNISDKIQAAAIITLVAVTWFYAKQTKRLVDAQNLKKDLEFNERRMQDFYNPFIDVLDNARKAWGKHSINEIYDQFLREAHHSVFHKYSYMVSRETKKAISQLLSEIFLGGIDEQNREFEEDKKNLVFRKLNKTRDNLHEERVII